MAAVTTEAGHNPSSAGYPFRPRGSASIPTHEHWEHNGLRQRQHGRRQPRAPARDGTTASGGGRARSAPFHGDRGHSRGSGFRTGRHRRLCGGGDAVEGPRRAFRTALPAGAVIAVCGVARATRNRDHTDAADRRTRRTFASCAAAVTAPALLPWRLTVCASTMAGGAQRSPYRALRFVPASSQASVSVSTDGPEPIRIRFRPMRSPSGPKMNPPSGRTTNVTASVPAAGNRHAAMPKHSRDDGSGSAICFERSTRGVAGMSPSRRKWTDAV